MSANFTAEQLAALNDLSPRLAAAGVDLGDLLDTILVQLTAGNLGIESDAGDVDSICLAGGHCSRDTDADSGLDFGYKDFRILVDGTIVDVAGDVVSLSGSNTNYVEVSPGGAVSKNTVGFTAGSIPLFKVVTGVGSITTVTQMKTLLVARPASGYPGSSLSAAAHTKQTSRDLGTVNATTSFKIPTPSHAAVLSALWIYVDTTVTANDTDYWTASLLNKGAAGSGTTAMLAVSDANTTKATGGSGITNHVARSFTLHGTAGNLVTAAKDELYLTLTKSGAGANLVNAMIVAEFTYSD